MSHLISCEEHFERYANASKNGETWDDIDKDTEGCEACIEASNKYREHLQQTTTIDPDQPRGQHIALTCKNHPELGWFTKNIDYIGARSVFYATPSKGPECKCPISDLEVVK